MAREVSKALSTWFHGSKGIDSAIARYGRRASEGAGGRAFKAMTRTRGRKIATGVVGGGLALNAFAAYHHMPGPNRSARNQNSLFLRRMRSSSATMGLPGKSMGGYTGNY